MNDDRSPLDDEVVSAVLDGEATPAERALVEGSPEGRARLEELRRAAAAVASPVTPLGPDSVDTLVARAVDELGRPDDRATSGDELAGRRVRTRPTARRPERTRRLLTAAVAAAAVVVLFVAVAGLARTTGQRDSASDASADSGASATANESAPEAATGLALEPADLGTAGDADEVLARYLALLAASPSPEHLFGSEQSVDTRAASAGSSSAQDGVDLLAACPVPPVAAAPDEVWEVTAIAELPTGPVVVMADRADRAGGRIVVVDAVSCAVLAEGSG